VLFLTNGQNKTYHLPSDEMPGINVPKLALQTQYLMGIVDRLANAPASSYVAPTFDPNGSDLLTDARSAKAILTAALAPGGMPVGAMYRGRLESDLSNVTAIEAKLAGGGTLTSQELVALRKAAQRLMCFAGTTYSEFECSLL
jgi:hypothetical protein